MIIHYRWNSMKCLLPLIKVDSLQEELLPSHLKNTLVSRAVTPKSGSILECLKKLLSADLSLLF